MSMEEIAEWWKKATPEQRMDLLEMIDAYPVGDNTWYVHPNKEVEDEQG